VTYEQKLRCKHFLDFFVHTTADLLVELTAVAEQVGHTFFFSPMSTSTSPAVASPVPEQNSSLIYPLSVEHQEELRSIVTSADVAMESSEIAPPPTYKTVTAPPQEKAQRRGFFGWVRSWFEKG